VIVQAADRFHVPPWALLEQGRAWTESAIATLSAERRAANEIQKREERKARMQRMKGSR
jgi:hypothetical protein